MNSFTRITKPITGKLLPLLPTLLILSLVPCIFNHINVSYIHQFLNRNAVFLLCIAIFFFVARDSGLLLPPSASNPYDELAEKKGCEIRARNDAAEAKETGSTVIPDKWVPERSVTTSILVEEKHTEPLELVVIGEASEELEIIDDAVVLQNPDPSCILNVDGTEWMEEESVVDEFNRRCEEFIEKIKREMQMEIGTRMAIKPKGTISF